MYPTLLTLLKLACKNVGEWSCQPRSHPVLNQKGNAGDSTRVTCHYVPHAKPTMSHKAIYNEFQINWQLLMLKRCFLLPLQILNVLCDITPSCSLIAKSSYVQHASNFQKRVLPLTLAYQSCQIFHDAVPHINISVPLQVMQEQQSLGCDALNTDQTYMHVGTGPKNVRVQKRVKGRGQGKEAEKHKKREDRHREWVGRLCTSWSSHWDCAG